MVPEVGGGSDSDGASGGSLLGRGWAPGPRTRGAFFLAVGLLLIAQPLVGGIPDALGLTGNTDYAAIEITPDGGEIDMAWVGERDRSPVTAVADNGGFTLLDCYSRLVESRECALESGLANGTVTVAREPPGWSGYTYHGRVYGRVTLGGGENVTLGLRPVQAREALADISIPARDWPDGIRRAVEEGSVTVDPPLRSAGAVLERDGQFYTVVPTEFTRRDEPAGPAYTAALAIAGVLSIQRGWRTLAADGGS
jgi:hypothetical protein